MSYLLAVDPGTKWCGCALFDHEGLLCDAYLVKNTFVRPKGSRLAGPASAREMSRAIANGIAKSNRMGIIRLLCLEIPQVYRGESSKGDPDDLIDIAGVAYALAAALYAFRVQVFRPHDWKKNETKSITQGRVLDRLSEEEKTRIVPAGALTHNIYDAIGIGLHSLGRYQKERKIFR